jgi:hypothetical protein
MHIVSSQLQLHSQQHFDASFTQVNAAGSGAALFGQMLQDELQAMRAAATSGTASNTPTPTTCDTSPPNAVDIMLAILLGQPLPPQRAVTTPAAVTQTPATIGTAPAAPLVQYQRTESCSFSAIGNVCLADGSTRQFAVGFDQSRRETATLSQGAALFRDPLVLDFGSPGTSLGTNTVNVDLNGDGKSVSMKMPGSQSALLFDDRNHNGMADDGSELFGPKTGDGFAELAKLDTDQNGWVDSGDAAWGDLKLWHTDINGKPQVETLAQAGVGALSVDHVAAPFTLKNDGTTTGQQQASGVWLGENGGAGAVRRIDVAGGKMA